MTTSSGSSRSGSSESKTVPSEPGYWPITDDDRGLATNKLRTLLNGDDPRSQIYAINTVLNADAHNLRKSEFDDKKTRLDAGKPTSIVSSQQDLLIQIEAMRTGIKQIKCTAVTSTPKELGNVEDNSVDKGLRSDS